MSKEAIIKKVRDASGDECLATEFLEEVRWGNAPSCVHCGSGDVYRMKDRKTGERERNFRWRCRGCGKQYSVRHGTIFEDSRLKLRQWLHAYWRAISSKKGVSALQISRECGITYQTALFLMHRIRFALSDDEGRIGGAGKVVEVDETYVGGKPRIKGVSKRGRGTKKAPVLGMVERDGGVRYRHMGKLGSKEIGKVLDNKVDTGSKLMTDEFPVYNRIGREFGGGHDVVRHSAGEYVSADDPSLHTNTIEGAFSLLKRGVYGTFHSVSKKHLHRYLAEFEFRYNTREDMDGERLLKALKLSAGKRLTRVACHG